MSIKYAVVGILAFSLMSLGVDSLADARGGGGGGGGRGGGGFGGGFGGGGWGGGGRVGGWGGGDGAVPASAAGAGRLPRALSARKLRRLYRPLRQPGSNQQFSLRACAGNYGYGNFGRGGVGQFNGRNFGEFNQGRFGDFDRYGHFRPFFFNQFFPFGYGYADYFPLWYDWWGLYPYSGYDYPSDYGYPYGGSGYAGVPADLYGPVATSAVPSATTQYATGGPGQEEAQYLADAIQAFREGNYQAALREAAHAAVDDSRNAKVHELMTQALLALKDYRDAAIDAHAVLSWHCADWATVYGFYGNENTYTDQLRALEKFSAEHPNAAEARFLLGYQYLIIGANDAAKRELAEAVRLTPKDTLAQAMLNKLEGKATAMPAGVTKPSPAPTSPSGQALPTAPVLPSPPSDPAPAK